MKPTQLALAAAALAILASQSAFALRCGDVLYQSVTLSGDVTCAPDEYGLIVGANGVRINLNGFTLQGSTASIGFTVGILSVNQSGTEIVGPGRIQDFNAVIAFREGGKHRVSGVTAIRGEVSLTNVGDSVVERNQLSRLSVGTASGGKAFYNRVEDNDFFPAPNPNPFVVDTSIQLAGCGTEKNVVTGNRMAPPARGASGFGLMIFGNASNNLVTRNTISRTVLIGGGTLGNEVSQNVITATPQTPMAGVEIQAMNVSCMGGALMGASNNFIRENEIHEGTYGVALRSLPGASCFGNEIRGNKISGARYAGLAFSVGSNFNDARWNHVQAPVHAIDYGAGNLWP